MSDETTELGLVVDSPADFGERADVVLGRHVPGVSRRVARALGLKGHLYLDGKKIAPSTRVSEGVRLTLRIAQQGPAKPVTVLERTDDFVYVLKPAGLHTQRIRPNDAATLADAVALAHPECGGASPDPRQGGAVHRLDRNTTGVVAFARNLDAWRRAREGFRSRRVLKLYRARVHRTAEAEPWPPQRFGLSAVTETPPTGPWPAPSSAGLKIAAPLGAAGRRQVEVRDSGRAAITVAWPLPESAAPHEEFLLQLLTGHRHQARVHLSWLGLPIVGDPLYGGPESSTLHLHAIALDLSAACPGEPTVVAPIPDDWRTPPVDTVD